MNSLFLQLSKKRLQKWDLKLPPLFKLNQYLSPQDKKILQEQIDSACESMRESEGGAAATPPA
jgi:hypothetical protein